jgi:hypothetical protein
VDAGNFVLHLRDQDTGTVVDEKQILEKLLCRRVINSLVVLHKKANSKLGGLRCVGGDRWHLES